MAVITFRTLNVKLARLAKRYPTAAKQIKQRAAAASLRELVLSTPVDTGLARGSWRVTQNRPSRAKPRKDPSGARTISLGLRTIRAIRSGNTDIVLTNTSEHLEFINDGTVRITKARPFAEPGFVDKGIVAAQQSVLRDSIFRIARF